MEMSRFRALGIEEPKVCEVVPESWPPTLPRILTLLAVFPVRGPTNRSYPCWPQLGLRGTTSPRVNGHTDLTGIRGIHGLSNWASSRPSGEGVLPSTFMLAQRLLVFCLVYLRYSVEAAINIFVLFLRRGDQTSFSTQFPKLMTQLC